MERASAFCSDRFSRGTSWLERHLRFDEESLRLELEKYESKEDHKEEWSKSWIQAQHLRTRLELKYELFNAEMVYVLKKVGSDIVGDFLRSAEKELFWSEGHDHLREDLHLLWFLGEVGLRDNKYLARELDQMIVRSQTVEGYIHCNEFDHAGPLRVLVALNPDSDTLTNALDYWLNNWKDIARADPAGLAVGILALTELDHERHSDYILEQVAYLKSTQGNDGSWKPLFVTDLRAASLAIWAIAKVNGVEDHHVQGGLEWLVKQQQHNGSWGDNLSYTAYALTALLAMGEGPKISRELTENRLMRLKQELRKQKADFVHTSPSYLGHHVSEIHDKIREMLRRAAKQIRITSPFIDMFYEDLINLKEKNPRLTIKVISRPEAEAEGRRKRIAKDALSLLDQVAEGSVIRSKAIHARIVIIDECEALISSADFTRDQLIDEFNAGIYTRDGDVVRKAAAFFDNIFELERAKETASKT